MEYAYVSHKKTDDNYFKEFIKWMLNVGDCLSRCKILLSIKNIKKFIQDIKFIKYIRGKGK